MVSKYKLVAAQLTGGNLYVHVSFDCTTDPELTVDFMIESTIHEEAECFMAFESIDHARAFADKHGYNFFKLVNSQE